MARARLTVDEITLRVEKNLKQIARRTHSDELVLQLIQSKPVNQFTEEDIIKWLCCIMNRTGFVGESIF
ncbi:hypothetical protein [Acinetobacter seifertii]|uniref:Uncharacterized protein n=1 Tax=Acinetobacter seifertii TaxID=1530123 RepID=A0A7H2PWT9_9GAMM|nr:hypothetical protein [Acinetobacter seifertii]QNX07322.1 hypothetical protein IC796_04735 [Acinetobacter seifertii]